MATDREPERTAWERIRKTVVTLTTILAFGLVWLALVAPTEYWKLTPGSFVRLPIEVVVVVGGLLLLPQRISQWLAAGLGLILGLLTLVKALDLGISGSFGRPFDPDVDWRYFGSGVSLLGDSVGRPVAIVMVTIAVLAALALLILGPLSVMRLTQVTRKHRLVSLVAIGVLGAVWTGCAMAGTQLVPGVPVASASTSALAVDEVSKVYDGIKDHQAFEKLAAVDAYRDTPGSSLLTGLRGKDVLFVFVESYGRVAAQDSQLSERVDPVLAKSAQRLRQLGFAAKSAFLTSPTFGGLSWLAHSTLQSGLWVDNQLRYDDLVASDRFTLSDAFKRAGWRTVSDIPSDHLEWPEGTSFYHYDMLYNSSNVGYVGPRFSYALIPDQFTFAAFQRLELAGAHDPIMAEIDLVSSHTPWAPLPRIVPWNQLGDGSIYNEILNNGESPSSVWQSTEQVKAAYAQSINYSMQSLVSFVKNSHDPNLVLVVLGDHQPAPIVSGSGASHDVPISIISHDPSVLNRISPWHWNNGLQPNDQAPVWPMDSFRDRFLNAYGPASH